MFFLFRFFHYQLLSWCFSFTIFFSKKHSYCSSLVVSELESVFCDVHKPQTYFSSDDFKPLLSLNFFQDWTQETFKWVSHQKVKNTVTQNCQSASRHQPCGSIFFAEIEIAPNLLSAGFICSCIFKFFLFCFIPEETGCLCREIKIIVLFSCSPFVCKCVTRFAVSRWRQGERTRSASYTHRMALRQE